MYGLLDEWIIENVAQNVNIVEKYFKGKACKT